MAVWYGGTTYVAEGWAARGGRYGRTLIDM